MQRVSYHLQNLGRSTSERTALNPSDDIPYGSFFLNRGPMRRSTSYQHKNTNPNTNMSIDEFTHVKALVRELHAPTKNVRRPKSMEITGSADIIDDHIERHSYAHAFPTREQALPQSSFSIPSLVVTGIDNTDHPFGSGSGNRRFSNFNLGLRRFSASFMAVNRSDSMGSLGHRTLLQYIEKNDLPGLRAYLDARRHTSIIDERDENGTSVLIIAANRGLVPFVRELISRDADVQAEDDDNWSSLLCASKNGHTEIVQILVEHGADIEHRDMGGWTSLMWASYRGHTAIAEFLLDHGADIFAHGNYHLGSLLWASGRGHTEIVRLLVQRGAKINVGDKYGTTALVWACRKGSADIAEILLKAGANVDTAGIYSWTALLVAVAGGYHECVSLLLEKRPNVNALDKDGMTALTIACREGLNEIASSLIISGAYVNIQDRAGDTPLIHAVKNGHRALVETLLKRHADVEIQGKERKTALYTAVEKGHGAIVKLLLSTNPDLELATKDGDTPLLKAVRHRNADIVQLLLDSKAKVTIADRRGDTALHIAMRARSKAIVELLLRNPQNSQLLYRANKAGETPYGLDNSHSKTILGQLFGARRLNTNEDSEGMLGYELYASALADVLSEPTLTTPITVGLYAKWGSGKSFLLNKLRDEMTNFAKQWAEPSIKAPWLLVMVCWHLSILCGAVVGLLTWSYLCGFIVAVTLLILLFIAIQGLKKASQKYDIFWAYSFYRGMMKRLSHLRLIVQVAFCHPPGPKHSSQPMPVRFHFAETSSAAASGESAVGHMLASLFEAIESHYGSLPTRLYRAFKPRPVKATSGWKWRRMCCIPVVILFELAFFGLITISSLLIVFYGNSIPYDNDTRQGILLSLYIIGAVLVIYLLGAIRGLDALKNLFFSQSRHLKKALKNNEGAPLTALGAEVSIMTDMVKCLDAFTKQQSRLVGIVDALDSCDTERILTVLSSVQTLLSSPNRPFVLLIAVDPHVIAKAAEANSRRLFTEGGIGGHDFLRNLVHLPVYLQNSGLRKVQRAQSTALAYRRNICGDTMQSDEPSLGHSASARRLSNASEIMSSNEKLRAPPPTRSGSKKLKMSDSTASSIGSNLHRLSQNPQGAIDLSKMVLTDDYFSEVNPRSMRRLMNVIYITVRLLKAFQIDFSWYRLSSWVNLTEQWPLRASMIVLQHDSNQDLDDNIPLQSLYENVRLNLANLRDSEPLLELDRDERKLEAFLQLHRHDLLVADLRIFLPFTINLDPYFRKVLKEDESARSNEEGDLMPMKTPAPHPIRQHLPNKPLPSLQTNVLNNFTSTSGYPSHGDTNSKFGDLSRRPSVIGNAPAQIEKPIPTSFDLMSAFPEEFVHIRLSNLTVEGVQNMIRQVDDLKTETEKLETVLRTNAISGRVLAHCDLTELKAIMDLNFGHWEIFKLLVTALRDIEKHQPLAKSFFDLQFDGQESYSMPSVVRQKSNMEKQQKVHDYEYLQVTLEEQMICGALQTLNEEAFEDVISSERPSPTSGADNNDFVFIPPTLSACPSLANSPNMSRRDSILKHSGSVKTDKRVSIKPDQSKMEFVSEKRPSSRPASLILSKGERPVFKLVRSPSIDQEDENRPDVGHAENDEAIPLVRDSN